TPRPVSSTTPETSQPTVKGKGPIAAAAPLPVRVFQSTGLTPAAWTRTSTSVGSGSGCGISASCRTSGPPNRSWTIARMVALFPGRRVVDPAAGHHGRDDSDLGELVRLAREWVAVEYDEIRKPSGDERAAV